MSHKYKVYDGQQLHFITITTVGWVDILIRRNYKDLLIESLRYCQQHKGLQIYAYVIMTSHLHLIVSAQTGYELPDIIRDFKKFTSKQLSQALQNPAESRRIWMLKKFFYEAQRTRRGKQYKVWQDGYHPVALTNNRMMDRCLEYIHQNPVEGGFVDEPWHYSYSSARNYAGEKGLLDIILIA